MYQTDAPEITWKHANNPGEHPPGGRARSMLGIRLIVIAQPLGFEDDLSGYAKFGLAAIEYYARISTLVFAANKTSDATTSRGLLLGVSGKRMTT